MKRYLTLVQKLQTEFKAKNIPLQVDLIPHEQNEEADLLSRLTLKEIEQLLQEVLMKTISQPNFEKLVLVMNVHSESSWMDPFIKYLDQGKLPADKNEAKKISAKA